VIFRPPTSCLFPRACVPGRHATSRPSAFLVLHESAGDLSHHFAAEIVAVGQVIARGGHKDNAALGQQGDAQLLHDELAGKPAGVFDYDGADAIAFDAVEEPCETLAALDRIAAANPGIVKPVSIANLEAGPLGKRPDCPALALV
jgi:hypothetical protein